MTDSTPDDPPPQPAAPPPLPGYTLVPGPHPPLSAQEEEAVRRIARGYSNKEIAARMGLSVKTIETYKARAMAKLGADGRVDLVRYAVARGWLRADEAWE